MKNSGSTDTARNPAWIPYTTGMSGDCHYIAITVVLFCEHVIVLEIQAESLALSSVSEYSNQCRLEVSKLRHVSLLYLYFSKVVD